MGDLHFTEHAAVSLHGEFAPARTWKSAIWPNTGEIYKLQLDGKVLGRFGKAGKALREFASIHTLDCRNPNEVYVAEINAWRIQKVTLQPHDRRRRRAN